MLSIFVLIFILFPLLYTLSRAELELSKNPSELSHYKCVAFNSVHVRLKTNIRLRFKSVVTTPYSILAKFRLDTPRIGYTIFTSILLFVCSVCIWMCVCVCVNIDDIFYPHSPLPTVRWHARMPLTYYTKWASKFIFLTNINYLRRKEVDYIRAIHFHWLLKTRNAQHWMSAFSRNSNAIYLVANCTEMTFQI